MPSPLLANGLVICPTTLRQPCDRSGYDSKG
jgi:hypothetical protein